MSNPEAKEAPSLNLPKGNATCTVSIIDTTCDLAVIPNMLVEPDIPGHKMLNLPDYSFHIKHNDSGEEVLFDMGTRPDWDKSVPGIVDLLKNHVPGLSVKKGVPQLLQEGGVKLENLKHFDHTGEISQLPPSVDLIVGPGFRDAFLPGYPSNKDSTFWEEEFKDRKVIEAPFNTKIGKFEAWDYFGDGSLFVLNVPGHAVGHISALIRTTEDTFIFTGGDSCHFTGDLRPSEYIPMPDPIPAQVQLDKRIPVPCPCSTFTACHPNQDAARTTPFYKCSSGPNSFYVDPPTAMESIRNLIEFDASPNVLVLIAHDVGPKDLPVTFFPKGNINNWKADGYKEKLHWAFLNELPVDGKTGRDVLVDGLYLGTEKVRGLVGME